MIVSLDEVRQASLTIGAISGYFHRQEAQGKASSRITSSLLGYEYYSARKSIMCFTIGLICWVVRYMRSISRYYSFLHVLNLLRCFDSGLIQKLINYFFRYFYSSLKAASIHRKTPTNKSNKTVKSGTSESKVILTIHLPRTVLLSLWWLIDHIYMSNSNIYPTLVTISEGQHRLKYVPMVITLCCMQSFKRGFYKPLYKCLMTLFYLFSLFTLTTTSYVDEGFKRIVWVKRIKLWRTSACFLV
jgi:hypothetical protein